MAWLSLICSSPCRGAAMSGLTCLVQLSLKTRLTLSSLTVPSTVNRNRERTYMSWKRFLGEPKWICFLSQAFLLTCPSMLAAANNESKWEVNTLPFLCVGEQSLRQHRTTTAMHGMEQPENGYLSVAWNNLSSCGLQTQNTSVVAQEALETSQPS